MLNPLRTKMISTQTETTHNHLGDRLLSALQTHRAKQRCMRTRSRHATHRRTAVLLCNERHAACQDESLVPGPRASQTPVYHHGAKRAGNPLTLIKPAGRSLIQSGQQLFPQHIRKRLSAIKTGRPQKRQPHRTLTIQTPRNVTQRHTHRINVVIDSGDQQPEPDSNQRRIVKMLVGALGALGAIILTAFTQRRRTITAMHLHDGAVREHVRIAARTLIALNTLSTLRKIVFTHEIFLDISRSKLVWQEWHKGL